MGQYRYLVEQLPKVGHNVAIVRGNETHAECANGAYILFGISAHNRFDFVDKASGTRKVTPISNLNSGSVTGVGTSFTPIVSNGDFVFFTVSNTLYCHNIQTNAQVWQTPSATALINLIISPDGSKIIAYSRTSTAGKVFNSVDGVLLTSSLSQLNYVTGYHWIDNTHILIGVTNNKAKIVDVINNTSVQQTTHPSGTKDLVYIASKDEVVCTPKASTTTEISVNNLTTGAVITPLHATTGIAEMIRLSPDGTFIFLLVKASASVYLIRKIDPVDYSLVDSVTISSPAQGLLPISNDTVLVRIGDFGEVHKINTSTGDSEFFCEAKLTIDNMVDAQEVGFNYKIEGTITEALVEGSWVCSAYNAKSNRLIDSKVVTGTTFTLGATNNEPVIVTVRGDTDSVWGSDKIYSVGDKIFATNPNSVPYYFNCITAGTSGASEPTWQVTTGAQTNDGSVVWEVVESIIQPITKMPIIPQPI